MELITKLQQVGLSRREAEVYIALLQKKEFTAPEIAKITTITRTKIYEILQNLVHKGACNESYRDGQKVYRGIEPQIALQNIISNYEMEIEKKKQSAIEQKKQAAILIEKELVVLHENNLHNFDPLDYIEVLTDVGQIRERWLNFNNNTKKEMLAFTKPPYTGEIGDNIKEVADFTKNRVIIKSIYEYNSLTSKEMKNLIKLIKAYQEIGEQAKIIKELPMKLVIYDEAITMFALKDRVSLKPSITTMIVDHPSFASALKNVFESYWVNAISIEDFKRNQNI